MNAIVQCRLCRRNYDKGAPAQEGQDDSTFVCELCAIADGGYPQNGYRAPMSSEDVARRQGLTAPFQEEEEGEEERPKRRTLVQRILGST